MKDVIKQLEELRDKWQSKADESDIPQADSGLSTDDYIKQLEQAEVWQDCSFEIDYLISKLGG